MIKERRKVLSAILVALTVAFLLTMSMPVAHATPSTTVSGIIVLASYVPLEMRPAGESDNVIMKLGITEEWHGGIEATSALEGIWILHDFVPPMGGPDTWFNVHERLTFQTATVLGESGTLTMELNIAGTKGHWAIIAGTDGLANLHGQGTLSLTTMPYTYTGQVHFDP